MKKWWNFDTEISILLLSVNSHWPLIFFFTWTVFFPFICFKIIKNPEIGFFFFFNDEYYLVNNTGEKNKPNFVT